VGSNRDESRSFRQLPLGVVDPQISTQLVRELLAGTADPQSAETAYGLRDRAPVDVLDEASNDRDWLAPIRRLARAAETGGLSCFVYEFVWPTSTLDGRLGSAHQAEIPFVFNTLDEPGVAAISGSPEAPGAREHARFVSDAWGAFVRHGVPGDPEPWPRWGAADTTVVLERGTATASEGHRAPALDLWDGETG
jgi:para-nitrobenzyl esterase